MLAEATALNGNYGDHWARREYTVNGWFKDWGPDKIQAPMLIVHGVNDDNVRTKQSLNMYNAAKEAGVPAKMIWHQGDHMTPTFPLANPTTAEATTGTMRPHGMYVGTFNVNGKLLQLQYDDVLNLWFSHYLYGVDNKVLDVLPNVIAQDNYITPVGNGANVWVHYNSWEPFATRYLTSGYNVPRAASPISMAGFELESRIAPEHVEVDAIPPDSEALGEGAGNAAPVVAVIEPAAAPAALAAALDEPDLVTLSSASAATLSLANFRTPTAGSLVYAVDLPQDFTVIGTVKVNIRAAFKTVGSTTPTDNLRMHVTLAEVPLTANTLRYYGASSVGTAPGRTMVQQRGAYMGSGVANINLVRFTQITNGSYRQICKGWFDLCNPKAGFEAYTSDIKDAIVPRNSIGVFYDYEVYLQPTIHSARAGNKLVALITFGGSGASGGASPASTTGNAAYTIDVDLNGTYVALPSAYGADLVGEPYFRDYEVAFVDWDGEALDTQTVEHGNSATAPPDPARGGYHFLGWQTADEAMWDFDDAVTSDLTLTAAYGPHAETYATIPATCEEPGLTTHYCSVCGVELRQEILPALGHVWDAGKVTAAPTFDKEGAITFTCKRCGEKRTEAIPKLVKADADFLKGVAPMVLRNGLNPDTQLFLDGKTLWLVIDGKALVLSTSANNRNVSGEVALGDGYFLKFDLKGNGSNIKTFEVVKR